jgi:hypothetical protein
MSKYKSILIRLFDNPMDEAILSWLDDIPKRQNGGKILALKAVLFEHAQQKGYYNPDPEPTRNNVIKVDFQK